MSQGERTGQDLKPDVAKQNVLQLETAAFEKGRRAHLTEQQARWERIRSQPQPLQLRRTPPTAMTSTSGDFPYAGGPCEPGRDRRTSGPDMAMAGEADTGTAE